MILRQRRALMSTHRLALLITLVLRLRLRQLSGFLTCDALQLDGIASRSATTSRRRFLGVGTAAAGGAAATATAFLVQPAYAVAPITLEEAETGLSRAMRLIRPRPPKILRQRLNLDFAVLLMRSSYAATDAIDVIAMNQFQRDFFLIRSAEYQPYIQQLGPGFVQQGDLTDPSYFDFISFAQYVTINRALSDPATLFEELQPIIVETSNTKSSPDTSSSTSTTTEELQRFETVVVRRHLADNELVPEHDKLVGQAILQYIDERYGDTDSRLPEFGGSGRTTIAADMEASLTQLVKLFVVNGFAWDGSVVAVVGDPQPSSSSSASTPANGSTTTAATFCLTLQSPATLWGAQSFQQISGLPSGVVAPPRRLRNDFLLKTAQQLALRRGYRVTNAYAKVQGNQEISYLSIR